MFLRIHTACRGKAPPLAQFFPERLGTKSGHRCSLARSIAKWREKTTSKRTSMARRGAFILFEGLDRSGKSTQVRLLTEAFAAAHKKVHQMNFPDRTSAIGKKIDDYLKSSTDLDDHVVHLLFSANRWEFSKLIMDRLQAGETIICDRYAFSGVAYSASKGLDWEWCRSPDRGLPAPDAVFFLDLPVDICASRGQYGEERYEKTEFQKKVGDSFHKLKDGTWQVVDATKSVEEVHAQIKACAEKVAEEVAAKPIATLWPWSSPE